MVVAPPASGQQCCGRFARPSMHLARPARLSANLQPGASNCHTFGKSLQPQLQGWRVRPRRQQQPRPPAAARPSAPTANNLGSSSSSSSHGKGNPAVQVLQGLELLALTAAAACQAATLLQAALAFSQAQYAAAQATEQQQQQQQLDAPAAATPSLPAALSGSNAARSSQEQQLLLVDAGNSCWQQPRQGAVMSPLLSLSLLVALMCGAALRYLQQPRPGALQSAAGSPSVNAAARLVALEVASQQQAVAITTSSRQLDKLQARVRVATSDLKAPIRQVQGSTGQAAAAIVKLSEQHQRLQQQLDGSQELMGALHALAAKQFKVSADTLQQLKQGQSHLSSSTGRRLGQLVAQQEQLQEQLEAQRRQLRTLEQQLALQQRRQQQHLEDGVLHDFNNMELDGGGGGGGEHVTLPDPWVKNGAGPASNGGASHAEALAGSGRT